MKKTWNIIQGHLMSAISYILPLIVGASLVIAVAKIGGMLGGVTDLSLYAEKEGIFNILYNIEQVGWTGINLMNAVFAGYLAYSIADKPGLAAGFIGGMLAQNMMMGFVGALVGGAFAGWITNVAKKNIHVRESMQSLVGMVIIPLISIGLTGILLAIILKAPLAGFNQFLVDWVSEMCNNGSNFAIVAAIIGAMIGFDLGGPVGKAAWMAVNALFMSGVYLPFIPMCAAICIPPMGYALATFIKKDKFNAEFREAGKGAFVMGLIGITEGAIPFTLKAPLKLIPINVIASAVGAAATIILGAHPIMPPVGGVYGAITMGTPLAYLAGIAIGSIIIGISCVLLVDFSKEEVVDSAVDSNKSAEDEFVFEEL